MPQLVKMSAKLGVGADAARGGDRRRRGRRLWLRLHQIVLDAAACQDVSQAWCWGGLLDRLHDDRGSDDRSRGHGLHLRDLLHLEEGSHGLGADAEVVLHDAAVGAADVAAVATVVVIVDLVESLKETLRDNELLHSHHQHVVRCLHLLSFLNLFLCSMTRRHVALMKKHTGCAGVARITPWWCCLCRDDNCVLCVHCSVAGTRLNILCSLL